jgi:hypothetical protein
MQAKLAYAIKFVANTGNAVAYHRDTLGLPLKFQSPEWSEFATGDVTLALHAASADNPAGSVQLGYAVDDLISLCEKSPEERHRLHKPAPLATWRTARQVPRQRRPRMLDQRQALRPRPKAMPNSPAGCRRKNREPKRLSRIRMA